MNIKDVISTILRSWSTEYMWVNINLIVDDNLKFNISEDIICVILDNLILNSIQQNELNQKLDISISISILDNMLHFKYSDNGNKCRKPTVTRYKVICNNSI